MKRIAMSQEERNWPDWPDRPRTPQRDYASFVVPCDDYDQGAVDILLTGRTPSGKKDRGDTEAVVQAAAVGAIVIVDDPFGRRLAERHSLEYHGAIWVPERLQLLGLLTPGMLRHGLERLKYRRIRFPAGAANELSQRLGEEKL
jgi:hypothetical protein